MGGGGETRRAMDEGRLARLSFVDSVQSSEP